MFGPDQAVRDKDGKHEFAKPFTWWVDKAQGARSGAATRPRARALAARAPGVLLALQALTPLPLPCPSHAPRARLKMAFQVHAWWRRWRGGAFPFRWTVSFRSTEALQTHWHTTIPPLLRSPASCAGAQGAQDARDRPDR